MRPSVRVQNLILLGVLVGLVAAGAAVFLHPDPPPQAPPPAEPESGGYQPRQGLETSGYLAVLTSINPWRPDSSLEHQASAYRNAIPRGHASLDAYLRQGFDPLILTQRANLHNAAGDPAAAYQALVELRGRITGTPAEKEWLYTVIYYQGVTALRTGENDNCVMCRGQSACIFPIAPAAVHTNPAGSRHAVRHFTEYLREFPDDLEVKWLLNLAHATLGEHPDGVDPRHRLPFAAFKSEFDVGRFEDVSHRVGLQKLNQSGGAILDDFDNDGLLDIVTTCWAPSESMTFYRNTGRGDFEDRTAAAGLAGQTGGLYCVQADYDNDGHLDVFVPRGSWMPPQLAQRPSLVRNNGNGTFTDVTRGAGLLAATNSTSATWADYDNDGHLDLFVCCQRQASLLYRNRGDGTFDEVSARAGLPAALTTGCLGAAWVDIDNDGDPDLFLNLSTGVGGYGGTGTARLFRNNGGGAFTDATREAGIDGPASGFSCWAFDFDNDGWLDILATTSSHTLAEVVQGLLDLPCAQPSKTRLFRNLEGRGFRDVAAEAGLTGVYSPMGSNFGDVDNDGYLDFYLGTGDPNLSTLVPNRLFRNVRGRRFAEITASSRTGHLQKGHGVALGDWDRNGTQDIFIELGGAVHGDRYHNVLFQNPGQGNNWLSVKLVGKKSNRAAVGARIKVVTAGDEPLTVHRHVSSGSSFGANPLEQHVGVGKATRVARFEVFWPTSGTTQVFTDVAVNQGVVVTEFAADYQTRTWRPIALP